MSPAEHGGAGEIRTHESLRPGGFQDRCHQPLGHRSVAHSTWRDAAVRAVRRSLLAAPRAQEAGDGLKRCRIEAPAVAGADSPMPSLREP